jgi:serine/threonine-protein kinase
MVQLLQGLQAIHDRQILHRDLKLENVLVRNDGVVKISDLGLMRRLDQEGLTRTGVLLGTAQYLPPEYIRSGEFDERGDLYAVAVMLFELASGVRRLSDLRGVEALEYIIKAKFPIPDLAQYPSITDKHQAIISRGMDPKPRRRYPNALAMAQAFSGEAVKMERAAPVELQGTVGLRKVGRSRRSGEGKAIRILIAVVLVAVGLTAGAVAFRSFNTAVQPVVLADGKYSGSVNMFGNTGYYKKLNLTLENGVINIRSEVFNCDGVVELAKSTSCQVDGNSFVVSEANAGGGKGKISIGGDNHTFEIKKNPTP